MRLLLVTTTYAPEVGGAHTYCTMLARALHARGDKVHVVAPAVRGGDRFDQKEPYWVTRVPGGPAKYAGMSVIVEGLLTEPWDAVVFAQWAAAAPFAARRAVTGRPRRLVVLAHGAELVLAATGIRSGFLYNKQRELVLRQATHVVANSDDTALHARARGAREDRLFVLHPGVDLERFRPGVERPDVLAEVDGSPLVVTVASLVKRKGVDTVIASLPRIAVRHHDVEYLVAGDGPDRLRLEALARSHEVDDRVRFLGKVRYEDLPGLYAAADVFVLAARYDDDDVEGFGIVLLEAQASGTPVVAARSGGMPDALVEDETGLLVPQGDAAAVAGAVNDLLEDPAKLADYGAAARRFASSHTWAKVADRFVTLLER